MNKIYIILATLFLSACSTTYYETVEIEQPVEEDFSSQDFGIPNSDFFNNSLTTSPAPLFGNPIGIDAFSLDTDISRDTAFLHSTQDRFIVVNIAAQTLRAFDNGREVVRSKIIVGKPTTRTPTQISRITSLKLNPDWHAPRGGNIERTYTRMIQNGEADKLREIGIDWYRSGNGYQFYQRPGDNNVLGKIKFEMVSPSNTYLHDTNRPDLFNLSERFLSFGCIRVDKWEELAAWIAGESVPEFLSRYENTDIMYVKVNPVTVYIVYWTEEIVDGRVTTYENVYNR